MLRSSDQPSASSPTPLTPPPPHSPRQTQPPPPPQRFIVSRLQQQINQDGIITLSSATPVTPSSSSPHSHDRFISQSSTIKSQQSKEPLVNSSLILQRPPSIPHDDQTRSHNINARHKQRRKYQSHQGANQWFCHGRLLTSSDSLIPFLLSLLIAFSLPILFLVFTAAFLLEHLNYAGTIVLLLVFVWSSLIMWASMIKSAMSDPGIILRDLNPEPETRRVDGEDMVESKYVRIQHGVVLSKWCDTCNTYRPPRTSHCRICDNCVDHTDHHCTFLNNCVGRRNYTSFITFVLSSLVTSILAFSLSIYHITLAQFLSNDPLSSMYGTVWHKIWQVRGAIFVTIVTGWVLIPMIGLSSYHIRLIWRNRTTIEMLRPKASLGGGIDPETGDPVELYSLGGWRNCLNILCRPEIDSWVDARGFDVGRQEDA